LYYIGNNFIAYPQNSLGKDRDENMKKLNRINFCQVRCFAGLTDAKMEQVKINLFKQSAKGSGMLVIQLFPFQEMIIAH